MPNKNIIQILKKLSKQYKNDISFKWKKRALDKAIKELKQYNVQITSGEDAKQNVNCVGKGIAQRIDEILETGSLAELIDVISPEEHAIREFMKITGVGNVRSKKMGNER